MNTNGDNNKKSNLILQIGLFNGKGDWVHGLEIARYIKENFSKKYNIIAFICPSRFSCDVKSTVYTFIQQFKLNEDYSGMINLKDNPFFDFLYNGYALNHDNPLDKLSELEKKYLEFIKNNHISFEIKISHLDSTFSIKGIEHNIIFMSEYGNECDEQIQNAIILGMGIGEKCCGIRIYKIEEEKNFWEKLSQQNPIFYNKFFEILPNSQADYNEYHNQRKLLPADLRSKETILEFIKINLIIYGSNCDFYLQQKYIDDIESLKEAVSRLFISILKNKDIDTETNKEMYSRLQKIMDYINGYPNTNTALIIQQLKEYCQQYNLQIKEIYVSLEEEIYKLCEEHGASCQYVTPDSIETFPKPNQIRIFSGFNFSDDLYKGLYLYNKQAGAGISGDDGFSLAVSGGNLPFHGNINASQVQEKLINDMLILSNKLELKKLYNYINCFLRRSENSFANSALEKMIKNTELLKLIKQEYLILVEHIKHEMNIFDKLDATISLISKNKKQTLSPKIRTF